MDFHASFTVALFSDLSFHKLRRGGTLLILFAWLITCGNLTDAQDRSLDGSGNNLSNLSWGAAGTDFSRNASGSHYADGVSSPAGSTRASARDISNIAVSQGSLDVRDPRSLTGMVYTWGQFLDHDLDLTVTGTAESLPITVPANDLSFSPLAPIPFHRSTFDPATSVSVPTPIPREQVNSASAWIDASMVYGTDASRAAWLRTDGGTGAKLKTSGGPDGALLPLNDGTQTMDNQGPLPSTSLFVAGDPRANEQIGLTSMQTLFVREHNRQVDLLAAQNPSLTPEQLYEGARKIVGAEIQSVTYNEFLPALLGSVTLPTYTGYKSTVDPTTTNAFATVGFRVGHTMLDSGVDLLDANYQSFNEFELKDVFFNPDLLKDPANGGIAPIFRGLSREVQQSVDRFLVDDVRDFLFGPPGSGGLDLASLNIQRGRDHGLPDYNTMRADFGLPKVTSLAEINPDPATMAALLAAYPSLADPNIADLDNIDAWTGALAEAHLSGSSVGPLIAAILLDQFTRLRDGDRFWYQNDSFFSPADIAALNALHLSDIIAVNTGITGLQSNIFFFVPEPSGIFLAGIAACGLWRFRRRRACR